GRVGGAGAREHSGLCARECDPLGGLASAWPATEGRPEDMRAGGCDRFNRSPASAVGGPPTAPASRGAESPPCAATAPATTAGSLRTPRVQLAHGTPRAEQERAGLRPEEFPNDPLGLRARSTTRSAPRWLFLWRHGRNVHIAVHGVDLS